MISRMCYRRVRYFFCILFLVSTFAIVFHHHEDGSRHSDCPICVASGPYCFAGAEGDAGFTFHQDICYLYSYTEIIHTSWPIFPTFAYRAPPLASAA